MDALDPAARAIGAVNTIVVHQDRLIGHNTDAHGFLAALRDARCGVEGVRALILGAGGAARAVAYALVTSGIRTLTIANRSTARTERLAKDAVRWNRQVPIRSSGLTHDSLVEIVGETDLLVNATPVGMMPDAEANPWPEGLAMPRDLTVCDLVYRPTSTALLRLASERGCRTVGGLGMLVHQGAEAFRLWTQVAPPVALMREACAVRLEASDDTVFRTSEA
jgi:shikimate dehydrogenase